MDQNDLIWLGLGFPKYLILIVLVIYMGLGPFILNICDLIYQIKKYYTKLLMLNRYGREKIDKKIEGIQRNAVVSAVFVFIFQIFVFAHHTDQLRISLSLSLDHGSSESLLSFLPVHPLSSLSTLQGLPSHPFSLQYARTHACLINFWIVNAECLCIEVEFELL